MAPGPFEHLLARLLAKRRDAIYAFTCFKILKDLSLKLISTVRNDFLILAVDLRIQLRPRSNKTNDNVSCDRVKPKTFSTQKKTDKDAPYILHVHFLILTLPVHRCLQLLASQGSTLWMKVLAAKKLISTTPQPLSFIPKFVRGSIVLSPQNRHKTSPPGLLMAQNIRRLLSKTLFTNIVVSQKLAYENPWCKYHSVTCNCTVNINKKESLSKDWSMHNR